MAVYENMKPVVSIQKYRSINTNIPLPQNNIDDASNLTSAPFMHDHDISNSKNLSHIYRNRAASVVLHHKSSKNSNTSDDSVFPRHVFIHVEVCNDSYLHQNQLIGHNVELKVPLTKLLKTNEIDFELTNKLFPHKHIGTLTIKAEFSHDMSQLTLTVVKLTDLIEPEMLLYVDLVKDHVIRFYCVSVFFTFVFASAVIMWITEGWENDWTFWNALWFVIVTVTTVGFGDLSPKSELGMILNCIIIAISSILLSWIFSWSMESLFSTKIDKNGLGKNHFDNSSNISLSNSNLAQSKKTVIEMGAQNVSRKLNANSSLNVHKKEMKLLRKAFWRKILINTAILWLVIFIGSIFFMFVELQPDTVSFHDFMVSLHFVVVTISTVGYGEPSPVTPAGKCVGALYIVFGVGFISHFCSMVTDYVMKKHRSKQVEMIMKHTLVTKNDLARFDCDGNGKIDRFEFLSKMLILTDEVSQNTIEKIMIKFNELDTDKNGFIDADDFD